MDEITELFNIIDEAKNIGEYNIANAAFAVLLYSVFNQKEISWLANEEAPLFLNFEIETSNEEEVNTYYDLLVIKYGEREACIPVPLVAAEVFAFFAKQGQIPVIDRKNHNREQQESSYSKREELKSRLCKFPDVLECMYHYLSLEVDVEQVEDLKKFILNLETEDSALYKYDLVQRVRKNSIRL